MHALRAGLKRIDNIKNKEKRVKQSSTDLQNDRSTWPILGFQESNGASPAKNPNSWEQISLKDDVQLLSSENLPYRFHENITENSTVFDSIERILGDESSPVNPATREPIAEYEENIPPVNNHSISQVKKISKWKQAIHAGESEQPLLVESLNNSSQGMNVNRLTPRNYSRWDPIEHDETTEPLSQRPMNNTFGIMSLRHQTSTNGDTQRKNNAWKQTNRPTRGERLEDTVRQNSKQMHVSATFDPFENSDDFGRESRKSIFEARYDFSTPRGDFQSFRTGSTRIDQIQERNEKAEKFQQSKTFNEFDRAGAPHLNDRSLQNPEYIFTTSNVVRDHNTKIFEKETSSILENKCGKNRDDHKIEDLKSFTTEKEPLALDFHETQVPKAYMESMEAGSTIQLQIEQKTGGRGHEFHHNRICHTEDHLEDAEDFGDDSTDISEETYYCKKMEHMRSIYESKCLRANLESPKKRKETVDDENTATSIISEPVGGDKNNVGLTFVALLSEFSGTLKQRTEQERAIAILEGRNISNLERVDGSSQYNKDRRNLLFDISGDRGQYPQFFLQKDPNIIVYLGNFEWLQYMNDIGSLNDETIFGVSHSLSEHTECTTRNVEVDDTEVGVFDSNIQAVNDRHSMGKDLTFSECNVYDEEQFIDSASPNQEAPDSGKLSFEDKEAECLDSATSTKSGFSSVEASPVGFESESFSEIESIDVEHLRNLGSTYDNTTIQKGLESDTIFCESASIQNSEYDGSKMLNIVTEAILDEEGVPTTAAVVVEKSASKPELNGGQCIAEARSREKTEDQSNIESSSRSGKTRRKTLLASVRTHLDSESQSNGVPSRSPSSPIKSMGNWKSSHSVTISPTAKDKKNINSELTDANKNTENPKSNFHKIKIGENILSTDILLHEKNEVDTYIDLELELKKVEDDEQKTEGQKAEEMEKQARRRARWKRRIIAEHLEKQSVDVCNTVSKKEEDPIGASLNEIEMINTFLTVLGPDFDGSLSSKELEDLHHRSENAGLRKEFIDRMLGQSAGITWGTHPSPTASDETYDDHGFTRKTPKSQSKFDCLVETFWAESSNIVGGDMVENIQAALSGDGESNIGLRSADSTESNSRWRSVDMIENIKASLSGDSSEKGWRSLDMIGNIKASLSGESNEKGWNSSDVIGSIKASLSGEGNESGWRSSDVIGSIKAALSRDSESKGGSWSSDISSGNVEATSIEKGKNEYEASGEGPMSSNDALINSSLHEC